MKILKVMKNREYLLIALATSLVFVVIYVYTQVLGIVDNVLFWFETAPVLNLILFAIFAALLGITVSFQVYSRRQPKTCGIGKAAGATSTAATVSLLVAQCPACASLGALILPLGVASFFVKYSIIFDIVSIGLMLFTINYLGGFRKD